jgi:hypothetical protein
MEDFKAGDLDIEDALEEIKSLEHNNNEFDGDLCPLFVRIDRIKVDGREVKTVIQLIDEDNGVFDLLSFTTRPWNSTLGKSIVYFKLDSVHTENERALKIINAVGCTLLKFYTEERQRPLDADVEKRPTKRSKGVEEVKGEEEEEEKDDALKDCKVLGLWGWMGGAF